MKINLVGFGVMGRNHFRVLMRLKDYCELTAVCDIDERNRVEIENCCNFYKDFEEMLDKEKPDALIIATPPQNNILLIRKAMKKGIRYFLVEKPLTILDNIKEAEQLLEETNKNKVIVMVGEITCYDPATRALKKNIDKLGEIKTIFAIRSGKYPFRFTQVGVNEDLLTHDLSFARYLLDWQKFQIKNIIKASLLREKQLDFIAIDSLSEKNIRFIAISSWLTEEKIRLATVLGEKAVAQVNFLDESRYVRILPPKVIEEIRYGSIEEFRRIERERYKLAQEIELENKEPLEIELMHFIDCIKKEEEPLTNIARAVENLRIIEQTKFFNQYKFLD